MSCCVSALVFHERFRCFLSAHTKAYGHIVFCQHTRMHLDTLFFVSTHECIWTRCFLSAYTNAYGHVVFCQHTPKHTSTRPCRMRCSNPFPVWIQYSKSTSLDGHAWKYSRIGWPDCGFLCLAWHWMWHWMWHLWTHNRQGQNTCYSQRLLLLVKELLSSVREILHVHIHAMQTRSGTCS